MHCHSTCSDGALSVQALIERAALAQVQWFSITDHDTLSGQVEAIARGAEYQVPYVSGVEWSAVWEGYLIHVVGLDFELAHPLSQNAVTSQGQAREKRATRIAYKLGKAGFKGVDEWLATQADPTTLGRPHFAEFLVQTGQVKSTAHVFKHHLGAGKAGDVKAHWPDLDSVIAWITGAGGVAVLAHPHRYRMTWRKRDALLADFSEAGGQAVELGVPGIPPNMREHLVTLAKKHELRGSSGSDFHHDEQHWLKLGQVPPLPKGIKPVWELFTQ
ncbi:MAG: PHP domain-containing protein [Natronospirillum sp.]